MTESVTVSAAPSLLDLSSARIGTNVIEREVRDLPDQRAAAVAAVPAGAGSVNSGTGTFGDIRFSGRAVQQNIIRYDGVEGSAIIDASPGNLNGELPSPFRLQSSLENVQEFRVESSNYPAEYGTGTGGQITVISKSGTNNVHGSVFEYHRSDRFDAPNYFDIAKSPLKQNQFGASAGCRLKKDRTFLFGSYEGYRLESGVNIVEAVPSAQAWARAVPGGAAAARRLPRDLAPSFCPARRRTLTSTSRSCRRTSTCRRMPSARGSITGCRATGASTAATTATPAATRSRKA